MIGARLPRREDARLVRGAGRYVGDLRIDRCLDAVFIRSELAHGVLRGVDLDAARRVPGVAAAWAYADLPFLPEVPPMMDPESVRARPWPPLATDRVRYARQPSVEPTWGIIDRPETWPGDPGDPTAARMPHRPAARARY